MNRIHGTARLMEKSMKKSLMMKLMERHKNLT